MRRRKTAALEISVQRGDGTLRLDGALTSLGGWISIVLHTPNKGTKTRNSVMRGDVNFRVVIIAQHMNVLKHHMGASR